MSSFSTIVTIVGAKQRRYMRQFREANATNATRAKSLEEVGCKGSHVFQGLVARGVMVEVSQGRYYLDQEAADAMASRRQRTALIVGVALSLLSVVLWVMSR